MGFIADIFGGGNDFKAQQAALDNTDYASQLQRLMASGALNPVDFGQSNQVGAQQSQLANMLLNQAQGNGPSIAQNQLNQATNQNIAQGAGMIGSQRGLNPALAARMILNNTAAQNQAAAGQAAGLRAQEQLGALGSLGNVLGQQRGQDISQSLGQVQSGLGQVGTLGQLQNTQNAARIQSQQGADQINAGVEEANAKRGGGVLGGLLNAAGGALGLGKLFSQGGPVMGEEWVEGDSPLNDTVPAMLSPGEIVIPKSAAKDPKKAKAFIDSLGQYMESQSGSEPNFGHVIAAQRALHERLKGIEKMCYGGMV